MLLPSRRHANWLAAQATCTRIFATTGQRPARSMLRLSCLRALVISNPTTNRDVLGRLAVGLREGGRVILDLWNQEFFAAHQGERELETASGVVRESKRLIGDRLCVQLDYPDGAHEEFEWQLFPPAQMISLAQSVGLGLILSFADLDTASTPSPAKPRIQFVLERPRKV